MGRATSLLIRWLGVLVLVCPWVVPAAQAQARFGSQAREFDRVRLTGVWWAGSLDGRITPPDVEGLPPDIDVGTLGVGSTESGWMGEADFGLIGLSQ